MFARHSRAAGWTTAYILSPETSYGEAAAVINALDWDTDGKDNHLRLLRRLQATDPQAYRRFGAGKGSTRVLRRRLSVGDGRLLRHAARNTCSGRQGARRRSFS
jgi:hypothetical protein